MTEKFLTKSYGKKSPGALRAHYDAWADSYDAEIAENGYATPARCAAALAATGLGRSAAILDLGCGTGLSGVALAAEGFTVIDGTDLSPGMLKRPRRAASTGSFIRENPMAACPRAPIARSVPSASSAPVPPRSRC